jgi:hypothetical protein
MRWDVACPNLISVLKDRTNTCSQDDDSGKSKSNSSKQNVIERKGQNIDEKEFEQKDATLDRSDNEVVSEMSSLSNSSPCDLASHGHSSRDSQISSNIGLTSRRLSAVAKPKSNASNLKILSTEVHVGESNELREVVINGGSSRAAAGAEEAKLQQRRSKAVSATASQRGVALGSNCLPPACASRAAAARKQTQAVSARAMQGERIARMRVMQIFNNPSKRELIRDLQGKVHSSMLR